MLTGEIRSQVDALWNAFWTGGISNPLEEKKGRPHKLPALESRVFPAGRSGPLVPAWVGEVFRKIAAES